MKQQFGDAYEEIIDNYGNIIFSDTFNHCIRKINKSNTYITTIAGVCGVSGSSGDKGPATAAKFYYPNGVAVDKDGNIIIADYGNSRIRKIDTSTVPIITTIAGTGTPGYSGDRDSATEAMLKYPFGITVDNKNNIYIADSGNSCIRKVSAVTEIITTVAGTGTSGYNGDGIYATEAMIFYPFDVTVSGKYVIYIADTYNNRIRMISEETGIITTVAGTGSPGYSGDGGLATEAKVSVWSCYRLKLRSLHR
jgi:sugar lactone lactonase YvrE